MQAGLRTKLLASLLVIAVMTIGVMYLLSSGIDRASEEDKALDDAVGLTRILASYLADVELRDEGEREAALRRIKLESGVLGAFVVRSSGVPLVAADERQLDMLLSVQDLVTLVSSARTAMIVPGDGTDGLSGARVVAYAPIVQEDDETGRPWNLLTIRSISKQVRQMEMANQVLLVGFSLGLVLIVVIGYFFLSRILVMPVQNLIRVTKKAGLEPTSPSLRTGKEGDEMERLETAVGQLSSQLQDFRVRMKVREREREHTVEKLRTVEESLERSEKLASVGVLTAGFAHEIGNPMGVLQGYVDLLGDADCSPEDREEYLERVQDSLKRMDRILRDLLRYSRPSPRTAGAPATQMLESVENVVGLLAHQSRFRGVEVQLVPFPEGSLVEADRGRLEQVLLNLLLNAADAMDSQGSIHISFEEDGPYLLTHIQDTGPGIALSDLEQLFDPFFSTKEEGLGTGLGLPISKQIINAHGGDIHVSNAAGGGARFTIRLWRSSQV